MVFLKGKQPHRTPAQKAVRYAIGAISCALIVFILWQIPYNILREERFRIYGETSTTGIILEVGADASGNGYPFMIRYKYVDADGLAREASAPLPRELWEQYRPGSPIEVIYITSRAEIARVPGEIEPRFQLWLRSVLQ